MKNDSDPIPPKEYAAAWTKLLDDMGPETVRLRLCSGEVNFAPNVFVKFTRVYIDGNAVTAKRPFVEAWLAEKTRKDRVRATVQNALIWIGAVAAVTGAATGLISIFG